MMRRTLKSSYGLPKPGFFTPKPYLTQESFTNTEAEYKELPWAWLIYQPKTTVTHTPEFYLVHPHSLGSPTSSCAPH